MSNVVSMPDPLSRALKIDAAARAEAADPLATLRKAARARRRGDDAYREALLAAVAAGISQSEIARTLGIRRQVIQKWARRQGI